MLSGERLTAAMRQPCAVHTWMAAGPSFLFSPAALMQMAGPHLNEAMGALGSGAEGGSNAARLAVGGSGGGGGGGSGHAGALSAEALCAPCLPALQGLGVYMGRRGAVTTCCMEAGSRRKFTRHQMHARTPCSVPALKPLVRACLVGLTFPSSGLGSLGR